MGPKVEVAAVVDRRAAAKGDAAVVSEAVPTAAATRAPSRAIIAHLTT